MTGKFKQDIIDIHVTLHQVSGSIGQPGYVYLSSDKPVKTPITVKVHILAWHDWDDISQTHTETIFDEEVTLTIPIGKSVCYGSDEFDNYTQGRDSYGWSTKKVTAPWNGTTTEGVNYHLNRK